MTKIENYTKEHFHLAYENDPISFIRDYRIGLNNLNLPNRELLPLHEFEEVILNSIHENRFNIIKKSRQMHMSSVMAAYCAWKMIFSKNYNIIVVAPNSQSSVRFIERVREILKNYSNDFFNFEDDYVDNYKAEIRLSNGCFIKGSTPTADAGKGHSIDMLIFDEAAYIKGIEEIWMGLGMVLSSKENSKCIICSTPKDYNFFYKIWCDSLNGNNDFVALQLNWTMNPAYNKGIENRDGEWWSPWYESMCRTLAYDKQKIAQELLGEFSVDRPDSYRINLRIKTELYDKMMSKINRESNISDYIRKLIEEDLK